MPDGIDLRTTEGKQHQAAVAQADALNAAHQKRRQEAEMEQKLANVGLSIDERIAKALEPYGQRIAALEATVAEQGEMLEMLVGAAAAATQSGKSKKS